MAASSPSRGSSAVKGADLAGKGCATSESSQGSTVIWTPASSCPIWLGVPWGWHDWDGCSCFLLEEPLPFLWEEEEVREVAFEPGERVSGKPFCTSGSGVGQACAASMRVCTSCRSTSSHCFKPCWCVGLQLMHCAGCMTATVSCNGCHLPTCPPLIMTVNAANACSKAQATSMPAKMHACTDAPLSLASRAACKAPRVATFACC